MPYNAVSNVTANSKAGYYGVLRFLDLKDFDEACQILSNIGYTACQLSGWNEQLNIKDGGVAFVICYVVQAFDAYARTIFRM